MSKHFLISFIALLVLVGCGSPEAETVTVKETVVAEVPVTVEVVKEVEVTRLVEVEVTPEPTDTPMPPPTAEASSEGVIISEPIVIPASLSGYIEVIAFVENQNEGHFVDLGDFNISAYDADGNIIATNSVLEDVPAGTTVPIITSLDLQDQDFDTVEVTLFDTDLKPISQYADYDYVIDQANQVGNKIVGIVANQGNDTSSFLKVVVIGYDADGNVVGTDFAYADDNGPGTSSPFELSIRSFEENLDSFELLTMPSNY